MLLYMPTYQYVVRADLQGLTPGLLSTLSARFSDVYKWYLKNGATSGGG